MELWIYIFRFNITSNFFDQFVIIFFLILICFFFQKEGKIFVPIFFFENNENNMNIFFHLEKSPIWILLFSFGLNTKEIIYFDFNYFWLIFFSFFEKIEFIKNNT